MLVKALVWFARCSKYAIPINASIREHSNLQMARSKKACIVFFDEVDAIGGVHFIIDLCLADGCFQALDLTTALVATTKCRGPCCKSVFTCCNLRARQFFANRS